MLDAILDSEEICKRNCLKIKIFEKRKLYACFGVSFKSVQIIGMNELLCMSNLYGGHLENGGHLE
jgi:hypothetical protein